MTAPDRREQLLAVWGNPPGLGALTAVNHTSIGRRFIITGFLFFLVGGLLAMLMRGQLAWAGGQDLDFELYNQLVTMHGTTMMFLFAVPAVEGFAVYLIPKMIGARDLPFPRLSAYGYWCYLLGGLLLYSSFLVGQAPNGGWFMYVPLNAKEYTPGLNADFWLLGITFVEISAVSAAVEIAVAVLRTRAPGMTLSRMPLFAWYMLVTAFMIIFGFPPLILASVLLEIERTTGWVFFDAAAGGDPLLWQHLFWLFGHPEVYIIFLPAAGVVTMVVEAFTHRGVVGYTWVVAAVVSMGFLSFGLWVHHMYTVGLPPLSMAFFSAASMAVAIPSGIQVFAWLATLFAGRPRLRLPLIYVLGFLFIFVLGGLTGVMVALVPFDSQVHDTHFVVAHFHYVLFGGMVFPLVAGLYYWLPLESGRRTSEALGRLGFWALFVGFNLTFLPMHLTGLLGMPRRVYTYPEGLGWEWLNAISTIGSYLLAAGVAAVLVDLVVHFRGGEPRGRNLWRAGTLEWLIEAPVPPYNFVSIPKVNERMPLWKEKQLAKQTHEGEGYLASAQSGRRETFGTSTSQGKPEQVVILPASTWIPLLAAVATLAVFVGLLISEYLLSLLGVGATVALLLWWAWRAPYDGHPLTIDAGHGLLLPHQGATVQGPGRWGLAFTLLADATAFGSLVFAYLFLWTVAPAASWPPGESLFTASLWAALTGFAALLGATGVAEWGYRGLRRGLARRFRIANDVALALILLFITLQGYWVVEALPNASEHAYFSVVKAIWSFALVHAAIALLLGAFVAARVLKGNCGPERPLEAAVARDFWLFSGGLGMLAYVTTLGAPFLL